MLPPIIRTTPNSPTVWANPKTLAVIKPERAKGTATVKKRSSFDAPKVAATSMGCLPIDPKEFCSG